MMLPKGGNLILVAVTLAALDLTANAAPAQSLSDQLQAIEAEAEALQQQEREARRLWEEQRGELEHRRRELAEKTLDAALERERLSRRKSQAASELNRVQAEADNLRETAEQALRELNDLAGAVDLHLAESPDRNLFSANQTGPRPVPDRAGGDWLKRAEAAFGQFILFDEIHAAATRIRLVDTRIYTEQGLLEEVELLAAGRIAYAYRTTGDGRLGVAVNSPADATGYRWARVEDRRLRAGLEAVFGDVAAARTPVMMPMDVTGRMTAETGLGPRGLGGRIGEGGVVMIPLLLVALAAVVLMSERTLALWRAGRGEKSTANAVMAACRERDYKLAEKEASNRRSMTACVLEACLQRRRQGKHAMEDAIQEQLLHEAPRLERFLSGVAVLGAAAPLLGLLGTVTGIIQTFAVITAFGDAEPSAMAGGISEALITTAAGLAIAIPILLVHSLLRGKADHIIGNAEKNAATLLNILGEEDA